MRRQGLEPRTRGLRVDCWTAANALTAWIAYVNAPDAHNTRAFGRCSFHDPFHGPMASTAGCITESHRSAEYNRTTSPDGPWPTLRPRCGRKALAAAGLLSGDQRCDDAPWDGDAAAEHAEPWRGADDDAEPASADVPPPLATSTPESLSRHSSQNASGAAMPASAATTGRIATSLRAAIAFSAEVSMSTIHSRADMVSAPSASLRQ